MFPWEEDIYATVSKDARLSQCHLSAAAKFQCEGDSVILDTFPSPTHIIVKNRFPLHVVICLFPLKRRRARYLTEHKRPLCRVI